MTLMIIFFSFKSRFVLLFKLSEIACNSQMLDLKPHGTAVTPLMAAAEDDLYLKSSGP